MAKNKKVGKDDLIMLNITGGGEERFKKDRDLYYLKPSITFDINPDSDEIKSRIKDLF